MDWKAPKKSHSLLRAKRTTFLFWVDKSSLEMPKVVNLARFWKSKASAQTVFPDKSLLKGQKLVGNAKIEKFKWDTLGDFRTLWLLGDGLLFFSKMHDHPFLMHSDWQAVTSSEQESILMLLRVCQKLSFCISGREKQKGNCYFEDVETMLLY